MPHLPGEFHHVETGTPHLEHALKEWSEILGPRSVLRRREAVEEYTKSTTGPGRNILAALRPLSHTEVASLVTIAAVHGVPLYPISTGRNWGLGDASPVVDGCVIVDLSGMNRILDIDPDLGTITLEPGVTQQHLHTYLTERNLPYYVPITGAGPECSLMGNALERGDGVTPLVDHFSSVLGLEAVLPDGQTYCSPHSDPLHKWGIGPYLDGLFSQGNFGIVTRMTLALARRAPVCLPFSFGIQDEEKLGDLIAGVQAAIRGTAGVVASLKLLNLPLALSLTAPYPFDRIQDGSAIPSDLMEEMGRTFHLPRWSGTGVMYGEEEMVQGAASVLQRKLSPACDFLTLLTPSLLRKVEEEDVEGGEKLRSALRFFSGIPSENNLLLAYWKSGRKPGVNPNPARDGCGLFWYLPVVPMKGTQVRAHLAMVNRVCGEYGLDAPVGLLGISDRHFLGTVPLLFRGDDPDALRRARSCYQALVIAGEKNRFPLYRAGIDAMKLIVKPEHPHWRLAQKLKTALDPRSVISPGRYGSTIT